MNGSAIDGENGGSRCVYVVDDDPSMRTGIARLLQVSGFRCRTFESALAYLDSELEPREAACLVLDVRMPDVTGLELQQRLPECAAHNVPIVFISAHGDIPMAVQAVKDGAVTFLQKPFEPAALVAAVEEAMGRSVSLAEAASERDAVLKRFALLSPREKEVFWRVTRGLLNKQIAADLGIAEKTVKIHRARVMSKMAVNSLADLVRMAGRCVEAIEMG